jgi:hypothetical protein
MLGDLHCINQRSFTLETIRSFLADLIQEVIKRSTEDEDLKDLILFSICNQSKRMRPPTEFI